MVFWPVTFKIRIRGCVMNFSTQRFWTISSKRGYMMVKKINGFVLDFHRSPLPHSLKTGEPVLPYGVFSIRFVSYLLSWTLRTAIDYVVPTLHQSKVIPSFPRKLFVLVYFSPCLFNKLTGLALNLLGTFIDFSRVSLPTRLPSLEKCCDHKFTILRRRSRSWGRWPWKEGRETRTHSCAAAERTNAELVFALWSSFDWGRPGKIVPSRLYTSPSLEQAQIGRERLTLGIITKCHSLSLTRLPIDFIAKYEFIHIPSSSQAKILTLYVLVRPNPHGHVWF